MLNEQLKELIKREADALYDHLNEKAQEVDSYDFGLPMANRQTQPIVKCLSQYAEKWQEAEAEKAKIHKVLNSALTTSERAIEKLQEAEVKAERYEKALKEIAGYSGLVPPKQGMIDIAREALTPKTGSDDTDK